MNISKITDVLESNGLSNKEARTYAAMLGLGDTTPYQIAKKSGLKAPITYIVLDDLLHKGLVLKTPFKSGWRFRAREIDEYLVERQNATRTLSSISSTLNSLILGAEESRVLVYEGVQEIKAALRYKIEETRSFVAFYGSARSVSKELNETFIDWYAELKRHSISQRVIAPADPTLAQYRLLDAEYGNEFKEIDPKKYDSDSSIEIHNDFVRIVMLAKSKCVVIEDKNLAKVLKNIFELVWGII